MLQEATRDARAADLPCKLYTHHAPRVVRTQGHHVFPMYLQRRVWGEVRDETLMWLCGTCHDSVHEWLGWLLGETRRPNPEPGRYAKAEAEATLNLYQAAVVLAERDEPAT